MLELTINNSKKIYYSKERHDERERDAMLLQAFIDKNKTVQASDNSVSQEDIILFSLDVEFQDFKLVAFILGRGEGADN